MHSILTHAFPITEIFKIAEFSVCANILRVLDQVAASLRISNVRTIKICPKKFKDCSCILPPLSSDPITNPMK